MRTLIDLKKDAAWDFAIFAIRQVSQTERLVFPCTVHQTVRAQPKWLRDSIPKKCLCECQRWTASLVCLRLVFITHFKTGRVREFGPVRIARLR